MSQGISTDVIFTGPAMKARFYDASTGVKYWFQQRLKLHIEETVDSANNTSTITVTAFACTVDYHEAGDSTTALTSGYRGWFNGKVVYVLNGTDYAIGTEMSMTRGNAGVSTFQGAEQYRSIGYLDENEVWHDWTGTVTIPHASDGTLNIQIGFRPLDGETNFFNNIQDNSVEVPPYSYSYGTYGNETVQFTTISGGCVRIHDGTNFSKKYRPYVWTGGAWVPAIPYVWNGSAWVACS